MIKIENLKVYGFESAMSGMRNPMNSWDLGDTDGDTIGDNDLNLLLRLCKAGADHRKVLRQMFISCSVVLNLIFFNLIIIISYFNILFNNHHFYYLLKGFPFPHYYNNISSIICLILKMHNKYYIK